MAGFEATTDKAALSVVADLKEGAIKVIPGSLLILSYSKLMGTHPLTCFRQLIGLKWQYGNVGREEFPEALAFA